MIKRRTHKKISDFIHILCILLNTTYDMHWTFILENVETNREFIALYSNNCPSNQQLVTRRSIANVGIVQLIFQNTEVLLICNTDIDYIALSYTSVHIINVVFDTHHKHRTSNIGCTCVPARHRHKNSK